MTPHFVPMKYVGFCDILGFSSAVQKDFDATIALYKELREILRDWPFSERAQITVYSDSILVVADELPPVLDAIVSLHWVALRHAWLIRGGVAYGEYGDE